MSLPLVVDAPTLNASLADKHLVIVDVRSQDLYAQGHLPGARHLDPAVLNHSAPPVNGLLPDADSVQLWLSKLGLNEGDHVVACDQGGDTAAARLIWVLHASGITACSWLSGGYRAWQAAGLPSNTDTPEVAAGSLSTAPDSQHQISVNELLTSLDDAGLAILDVRSRAEYDGSDVRAASGGHVPGALHLEWTALLDQQGCLKDRRELADDFSQLGITPEQTVVVYCQSHQRSSVTWLALKSLGFERVRAIDGAWSAWGNRADTPKSGTPPSGA